MAAQQVRRVAVIGAGPAGAIVTDALAKEQAFSTIRVFDRQRSIGGTWVLSQHSLSSPQTPTQPHIPSLADLVGRADRPVALPQGPFPLRLPRSETISSKNPNRYMDTGCHDHLHSNLPPRAMAFTQEPIPDEWSARTLDRYGTEIPFRHHEVIRSWVEGVFKRGGHEELVSLGTTVENVEKQDGQWVVTLRQEESDTDHDNWFQERFDAVVVASGHYYVPFVPDIPGMIEYDAKFPGRIMHTKHFRSVDQFAGKRVVVVGGSVSAFDAIHDIRLVSKLPVISAVRTPSGVFGRAPFLHPHVDNRPPIASFDAHTGRITFQDGTHADDVDVVLFATGYSYSFPFLSTPTLSHLTPRNGRIPHLYQHVFNTADPTLAFVGMVTGGFGLRIFEWQAVAVARVFASFNSPSTPLLPPRAEMEAWEQTRLAEKGDGPPFWTLMPDFETHFEAYRALAGEPRPGTTGRVLPRYEEEWGATFWDFVQRRIRWWEKEAADATAIGEIEKQTERTDN